MTDLSNIDPATLKGASRRDLVQLAKNLAALQQRAAQIGPQTDDELHQFIIDKYGIHIPRIAVTPGHDAPFDFVSDAFFQRETSQFVIANREGSKTFSVAIVHALMARFYPGYEGLTAGAIEIQSKRCYTGYKQLVNKWGKEDIDGDPMQSETLYKNGSKVEIVTGTYAAMNGPHSNLLHRDEVELFRRDAFDEGDNITKSGKLRDGREIKAHDILTSTRKKARGLVQEILDKVEEEIKAGQPPSYRVYKWGVAETVQRVPNCRHLPENANLPEDQLCPCAKYVNGYWDPDKKTNPRTLADVCNGRFGRSDGWRPLVPDIVSKFTKNSRAMWEAQQECMKVASEGLILANFSKETHGIRNFVVDPENGPIYQGVDFGGTNPHAVNWYQLLEKPVSVTGYAGEWKILPTNSLVCFGEIYITEIGNTKLADLVVKRETQYKLKQPFFNVQERYADIAAKAARLDWRTHEPPLPTVWRITREIDQHILLCQELVDNFEFFVDVEECPMFCEEAEAWQQDPNTGQQIDEFNHCFAGDTLLQTRDGLRMARDLEGETVLMLTQGGDYRLATWKSYGERDIYEVEFADGEKVRVTDGHQWVVQAKRGGTERVTTLDLEGRRVPTQAARWVIEDKDAYARGVQNGLIYGDGTVGTTKGYSYSWMHQYGDENCSLVERFFSGRHGDRRDSPHGVKVSTKMMPAALKALPDEDNPDYVRGFLAGLIAADGAVNKQGCCYISSSKREDIDKIVTLCRTVGVVVSNVEEREPGASNYPNAKTQFRIWITKGSLDETLLLKPSHRENGLRRGKWPKPHTITVVRVRATDEREEVFCCEEPITHTVVLGNGKLSSNCMSNFRYTVANLDRKIKANKKRGRNDMPEAASERPNNSPDAPSTYDLARTPDVGPASRSLDEDPFTIPMHQGPQSGAPDRLW